MAWSIHPKLLIFLHALQFIILDRLQLLHSFEKLKLQAIVSLCLVGCLLMCAPPPIPHLQLASFVYQYHQLSIMFFVVKLFVISPQLLHLKYLILLLLNCDFSSCCSYVVTTLALGLWSKQKLTKMWAKSEARESHFMLSRMHESVKEWTPTLSSELPL